MTATYDRDDQWWPLRDAKGRFLAVIVPAPPGPLHPETRALLDLIATVP